MENDQKREAIEDYGFFLEKSGYPPAAARVYALLLVWEPGELHFDQIQEALAMSKGATSGALKYLQRIERVKEFTRPGIRKRFYAVDAVPVEENVAKFQAFLQAHARHLERLLSLREEGPLTEHLQHKRDFLLYMEEQLAGLLEGWGGPSRG